MIEEQKKEIINSYKNPISYLDLYENFTNVESNIEILDINPLKYSNKEHNSIYEYTLQNNKNETIENIHDKFVKDENFVNLFRVFIFITENSRSSRRRDDFHKTTEYCLFYRGIRVDDFYIQQILPDKIIENESYYNDSTPGVSEKENIYFKISLLESERFLEKYNLDDHCYFLSEQLKCTEPKFGKVEKQLVYHEFGHILGVYLLNRSNILNLEIEEISLNGSLYFVKTFNFFSNDNTFESLEKDLNDDYKKTFYYFIYVLLGGIFNLYYFKSKPNLEDFEKIFQDDSNKEQYGKFDAKAGNDFTKVKDYSSFLNSFKIEEKLLYYFAYDIFYILDKHFIFYHLIHDFENIQREKYINTFNELFNGKIISYIEDNQKIDTIFKDLDLIIGECEFKGLMQDLDLLIEKFTNKWKRE